MKQNRRGFLSLFGAATVAAVATPKPETTILKASVNTTGQNEALPVKHYHTIYGSASAGILVVDAVIK